MSPWLSEGHSGRLSRGHRAKEEAQLSWEMNARLSFPLLFLLPAHLIFCFPRWVAWRRSFRQEREGRKFSMSGGPELCLAV